MTKKVNRALFVGRFQPFHNGHLKVVKSLLAKYGDVIVVVGSAEESVSRENPFTAGERVEMIKTCFSESERARLIIIPVRDVNNDSRWVAHVKSYIPEFSMIYSNNWLVKCLFSRAGYKVKKLEFFDRKNCEGKKLREMIAKGRSDWKKHVPKEVENFIERIGGVERMRKIDGKKRMGFSRLL